MFSRAHGVPHCRQRSKVWSRIALAATSERCGRARPRRSALTLPHSQHRNGAGLEVATFAETDGARSPTYRYARSRAREVCSRPLALHSHGKIAAHVPQVRVATNTLSTNTNLTERFALHAMPPHTDGCSNMVLATNSLHLPFSESLLHWHLLL